MKVLLTIDQTASLIAGLEAPSSTVIVEVAASAIPADIRPLVMPHYDVATGVFKADSLSLKDLYYNSYGQDLGSLYLGKALANADEAVAVILITEFAEAIKARDARYIVATESHAASLAKKEADEAERDRLAAETEAKRKAMQVRNRDVHEWDIKDGSIDQSMEPGIPYDGHNRAKTWMATVSYGGGKGKMERAFWGSKGKHCNVPSDLKVGDYVEGAAKDKKGRNTMQYVRVLEITDKTLTVREADMPGENPPDITAEVEKLKANREDAAAVAL